MISRPSDLVMYFTIFALVIVTFGIGYSDMLAEGASNETTTIFNDVYVYANSSDYFAGAGVDSAEAIKTSASSGSDSDSFIVQMGLGLLKMGKVWEAMSGSLNALRLELHIPGILISIIVGALVLTLAFSIYAWWRGNN